MIIKLNTIALVNEPKGLKNAMFKIVRDQNINGSFISDLVFWGDGYTTLLAIAQAGDSCDEIAVEIDNKCGFVFNGRIIVKDIEFDSMTCTATTAIEDNSVQSKLSRLASIDARFGQTKSVNGETISAYSGELISVSGRTPNQIRGFRLKESLTYLVDYLTDGLGNCNFYSEFNTPYQYVRYEIDCTLILVTNPSTVDFEFVDIYGQTKTISCPILSPANDNEYAAQIATGFIALQPFGDGLGPFYVERPVSMPFTGNTLIFHFWNPYANFRLLSTNGTGLIEGSAGPSTFTPTQAGTYGNENVFFTNGAFMNDNTVTADQFSISWEQMQAFLSLYNTSIEYNGNDVNFYHQSDTFDSTPSVTLTDVKQVLMSYSQPLAVSALAFSQAYQSPDMTDIYSLSKKIGYAGARCSDGDVRATSEFNYAITLNFADTANVGTWDTEQLYVFEAVSGAISRYEIREGTSLLGVSHFASAMHPFVARNQVFKNPNGFSFEDNVVLNAESVKIFKMANFTHPLTQSQIQAIKADPKKAIVFNGETGYIQDLEYNTETGMTTFNLLTE